MNQTADSWPVTLTVSAVDCCLVLPLTYLAGPTHSETSDWYLWIVVPFEKTGTVFLNSCVLSSVGTVFLYSCALFSVGTAFLNSCALSSVGTVFIYSWASYKIGTVFLYSCALFSVGTVFLYILCLTLRWHCIFHSSPRNSHFYQRHNKYRQLTFCSLSLSLSLYLSLSLSLSLSLCSFLSFPKIRSLELCDGQHNTKRHDTTQHNTTQHNTKQHNTTQHNKTQHYTTQHDTTRHYTTLHDTTQHNTTQHNLKPYCTTVSAPVIVSPNNAALPHRTPAHTVGRPVAAAGFSNNMNGGALYIWKCTKNLFSRNMIFRNSIFLNVFINARYCTQGYTSGSPRLVHIVMLMMYTFLPSNTQFKMNKI